LLVFSRENIYLKHFFASCCGKGKYHDYTPCPLAGE